MIALLVLGGFLGGLFVGRSGVAEGGSVDSDGKSTVLHKYTDNSKEVDFNLFWEVWDTIEKKSIQKPVDYEKLYQGAIKGMVEALDDPYSVYMTPEETQKFQEQLNGEFGGIGAELTLEESQLTVVSVLPGTPSEDAGLLVKDAIIKIDSTDSFGLSLHEAVSLIRGEKGSVVTLTVFREGEEATIDIPITRDTINVSSVKSEIKKDEDGKSVLYLSISSFAEKTYGELNDAIEVNLAHNPEAVILDLRGNSGGLLDQSVKIASEFLDNDQVVAIEQFSDDTRKTFKTNGVSRLKDLPLIVLVNGGSASASEILAGALRDNRGVQLIGSQTFGKGTVQEYMGLKNSSSLRISVAKWLTPSEVDINKQGLEVDEEIEITKEDFLEKKDPQLDRALEHVL